MVCQNWAFRIKLYTLIYGQVQKKLNWQSKISCTIKVLHTGPQPVETSSQNSNTPQLTLSVHVNEFAQQ